MRQYIALAIRYAPITITKQQLNLKQYPSRLRRGHWSTVKMRSDASKLMFLLSNDMMIRRNPGQSMGWRPLMAINPCLLVGSADRTRAQHAIGEHKAAGCQIQLAQCAVKPGLKSEMISISASSLRPAQLQGRTALHSEMAVMGWLLAASWICCRKLWTSVSH